jgi:hypothetical protein
VDQHQYVTLNGVDMPVYSRWSYDPADPYAITLAFSAEHGYWVMWSFARDLIIEGLRRPTGLGDVRVRPESTGGPEVVVIELESPDGYAVVEAERVYVEKFVTATLEAVPLGSERIDIDAFIAGIIEV